MAIKKIETLNKHQNPATNENEFDIENYMNVNWDKIKEVVDNNADELTTTQEKVTALETDNTKNKQDISDIKSEQETQNDLLERTQSALINITTEKSSNINVKDSSDLNAKIGVFGISEQETRSGINLTNYKEWVGLSTKEQITKKDDDEIICTITDSSYGVRDIERILKPNTNYTACVDSKFSGNLGSQYGLRVNINGSITSLKADGLVNFTTDETGKAEMRYYVGFPYSGENATLTVSNIRLYEGTYTKENIPDYEDYGASPSPEYPSEIENVEGNVDITVCNKNRLKLYKYNSSITVNGVTITINQDGTIKLNGTATAQSYIEVIEDLKNGIALSNTKQFELDTSKKYMFSIKKKSGTFTSSNFLFALQPTLEGTTNIVIYLTGQLNKLITNSDGIYRGWLSFASGSIFNNFILAPQIEEGETETDYILNEQQTITFPLSEGQKLYDKDYLASDGIHHKRKQIVLDGTENWNTLEEQNTENTIYITTANFDNEMSKTEDSILCNIATRGIVWDTDEGDKVVNQKVYSALRFRMWKKDFEDINAWKTYLAGQKQAGTPVIVECELEEEEIEPYTEEQQEAYNQLQNAKTYKTVTNVFTDNAEIEMEYIADTKTYVDNEINSIKEQLNTVNELLSTTKTSAMLLDNMQSDLESEVL